jgi:hypothetical protein
MARNLFMPRNNGGRVNGKANALLVFLAISLGTVLLLPTATADPPFQVTTFLDDNCGAEGHSSGSTGAGVSGHSVYFSIYLQVLPYSTAGRTISTGKSFNLDCWVHTP